MKAGTQRSIVEGGQTDGGGRARAHRVIELFFPELNKVIRYWWGYSERMGKHERVSVRSELTEKSKEGKRRNELDSC